MKSTKVQILGAVALHATTACTEDARLKYCWLRSTSLGYSQEVVICLALHVSGSRYACIYARLHRRPLRARDCIRHPRVTEDYDMDVYEKTKWRTFIMVGKRRSNQAFSEK